MLVIGGTSLFMAVAIVAGLAGTEWFSSLTGRRGYVVSSGSMRPAIGTGSYVMVRVLGPIQRHHVDIGEVITYRSSADPSMTITHRVVGLETTYGSTTYTTKGDANAVADAARVPGADVIGVHDFDLPWVGYVVESMHSAPVSASFIGAFFLASAGIRSGGDGRRDRKREKKREET